MSSPYQYTFTVTNLSTTLRLFNLVNGTNVQYRHQNLTDANCFSFQYYSATLNVCTRDWRVTCINCSQSVDRSHIVVKTDELRCGFRFPADAGNFSLRHRVQTGSGAY